MSDEDEYEVLSANAGLGVRHRYIFPGELHDPFSLTYYMSFIGQHARRCSRKSR
jgi:hypothetical protein